MTNTERIIMESIKLAMENEAELNARDIVKKVNYYNGNYYELKDYIKEYLDFTSDEIKDMPWQITNLTRKVIVKNSCVYKTAPTRTVNGNEEKYEELTADKDKYLRMAERQANLLYDIAFYVGWDDDKNKFLYKAPIRMFKPEFGNDDILHPTGIYFPIDTPLNKPAIWEHWTADTIEWLIVESSGIVRKDPKRPAKPNELGFLPFVFIHKGELIDSFQTGSSDDLINANELLNLSLTILNYLERDTSFKQVYGTGIQKTESVISRYNRMLASTSESAQFGVLDLQTNLAMNIEKIKFNITMTLNNWNMEPKWSSETGVPSGFSLVVKNMDLLEAWEQSIPTWREAENEIFEMENKIAGMKAQGQFKDFNVNFADIDFPIDKAEQRNDLDWKRDHGYISDLDIMRKLDIDGTDEELKNKLLENKKLIGETNKAGKPVMTLEDRLGQINA